MKYYVTMKIEARFVAEVEAESQEDARVAAIEQWQDADFGVSEDITGECIIVEDENGNYVWEK